MKRRPTAEDRDIAEYVRNLPPGTHSVVVDAPPPSGMQFMGLARLKAEGMMLLEMEDGKTVSFYPEVRP